MIAAFQNSEDRSGLIGTILFHGILLVLFILFGLTTPLPLPEEEGIVVNFGTSADGSGEIQPLQNMSENMPLTQPTQAASSAASSAETEAATQTMEESVALPKTERIKPKVKPTIEAKKPVVKPVVQPKETPKVEPKENPTPVKEEPKVNQNALYPGKKDNATNNSSGQGNTGTPGDQGSKDGSVESNNQGDGKGKGNAGVSYDLGGRTIKTKPSIQDNSQDFGIVVIDIIVDKYGSVVSATGPGRGSTTTSQNLLNKAKEAALRAKFSQDLNDLEERKGTITFRFSPK
jgi:outer membrane biosynthesis protein TonB